jgi:hypothetical protein
MQSCGAQLTTSNSNDEGWVGRFSVSSKRRSSGSGNTDYIGPVAVVANTVEYRELLINRFPYRLIYAVEHGGSSSSLSRINVVDRDTGVTASKSPCRLTKFRSQPDRAKGAAKGAGFIFPAWVENKPGTFSRS